MQHSGENSPADRGLEVLENAKISMTSDEIYTWRIYPQGSEQSLWIHISDGYCTAEPNTTKGANKQSITAAAADLNTFSAAVK